MDALVIDFQEILKRVKRLETRVVTDEKLIAVVQKAQADIDLTIKESLKNAS